MKKLNEYKELYYRNRTLEELFNEEIWYKIYELVYEKHFSGDFYHLPEVYVATIFNSAYSHCVCWNSDLLSNKSEIDKDISELYGRSLFGKAAIFEIACIYSVYLLHIKQLPKIPWRFDWIRRKIERKFDLGMDLNLWDIQRIEGEYPLDLSPHPDFEALERKDEVWWNEATGGYNETYLQTILSLYADEERERMRILLKEKAGIKLPAEAKAEEAEEVEEKAENGRLNIQQLILLFMEMLDLTLDPTFTNQSELARLIAAVSGFKFNSIRPKITKGISYDKKQVKQDAQRVASLLEKVKPGLAERIRRNINEE